MTENPPQTRLIVYDGDCPICTATANLLRKREWTTPHEVVAFQDLDPDLAQRMTEADIERQMLILDPATDEITGGFEALRVIEAAGGRPWLADLLGIPGIAQIGALGYRLFAVNRRLLSPVPPGLRCACDPDPTPWEQWGAWILLLLPVAALVALNIGSARTVFVAFCLLWMVPVLAGVQAEPGPGRIAGQLGVALSAAAVGGLVVWGAAGLWSFIDPAADPYRLLLVVASMWLVGGWMLWRRFRTLGRWGLFWLWQGPVVLALAILLLAAH